MTSLTSPIAQKINKIRKNRTGKTILSKKQIGYIVAGVLDSKVAIGFCLCHKNDKYDVVQGKRIPGFGRHLATARALKWGDKEVIEVPASIMPIAKKFAERCEHYYKTRGVQLIRQQPIPEVDPEPSISAEF